MKNNIFSVFKIFIYTCKDCKYKSRFPFTWNFFMLVLSSQYCLLVRAWTSPCSWNCILTLSKRWQSKSQAISIDEKTVWSGVWGYQNISKLCPQDPAQPPISKFNKTQHKSHLNIKKRERMTDVFCSSR